ncbi:MAG: heavy metal response regulator transcription factor [Betaproteobacteria bacterium]|nr:heavy metal response regulator transcription factor [Betaproteobacteria bacterium]
MKILIVEDDPKTGRYLSQGLTEAGFVADWSNHGLDGRRHALRESYELIVLDVMLPGVSGWEILRQIRQGGNPVPVLFLTARDDVDDRVKGLELGADDYLVKPFAFTELLARVHALLRRGRLNQAQEEIRAGDLELNLLRRRVTRAGRPIEVTAKEFVLLELFVRRQGQVLPRTLIASQVWGINYSSDTNAIDVAVRRLRGKVDDEFERKLIRTVRGMGYVLEASES